MDLESMKANYILQFYRHVNFLEWRKDFGTTYSVSIESIF